MRHRDATGFQSHKPVATPPLKMYNKEEYYMQFLVVHKAFSESTDTVNGLKLNQLNCSY